MAEHGHGRTRARVKRGRPAKKKTVSTQRQPKHRVKRKHG